jgi:hypothetical protein
MSNLPDIRGLVRCHQVGEQHVEFYVTVSDAKNLLWQARRLQAEVTRLNRKLVFACDEGKKLAADNERLRAIIENLTAAILSCGPYQPLYGTNLVQIALDAAEAAEESL